MRSEPKVYMVGREEGRWEIEEKVAEVFGRIEHNMQLGWLYSQG